VVTPVARQTPPAARPNKRTVPARDAPPAPKGVGRSAGRLLEPRGNARPREMVAPLCFIANWNRIRLTRRRDMFEGLDPNRIQALAFFMKQMVAGINQPYVSSDPPSPVAAATSSSPALAPISPAASIN
jgi:hypothetical protein